MVLAIAHGVAWRAVVGPLQDEGRLLVVSGNIASPSDFPALSTGGSHPVTTSHRLGDGSRAVKLGAVFVASRGSEQRVRVAEDGFAGVSEPTATRAAGAVPVAGG